MLEHTTFSNLRTAYCSRNLDPAPSPCINCVDECRRWMLLIELPRLFVFIKPDNRSRCSIGSVPGSASAINAESSSPKASWISLRILREDLWSATCLASETIACATAERGTLFLFWSNLPEAKDSPISAEGSRRPRITRALLPQPEAPLTSSSSGPRPANELPSLLPQRSFAESARSLDCRALTFSPLPCRCSFASGRRREALLMLICDGATMRWDVWTASTTALASEGRSWPCVDRDGALSLCSALVTVTSIMLNVSEARSWGCFDEALSLCTTSETSTMLNMSTKGRFAKEWLNLGPAVRALAAICNYGVSSSEK
mmetsp:Transcript_33033/g.56145  ORF Transcript_33033/g.56145 Transcript_33033/m.56145 type:complete len:317 (-) Transcript_33033:97-1047(-)